MDIHNFISIDSIQTTSVEDELLAITVVKEKRTSVFRIVIPSFLTVYVVFVN